MRPPRLLDIASIIEDERTARFRITTILLCALVAFIEGFDTQSVGFVAPSLSTAFNLSPGTLGLFFSTGLFGLMGGAILLAPLADRIGRRPIILCGTLLFGAAAIGVALAPSTAILFAMRLLMGLGIGAVMPNLIALTAEYSKRKSRGIVVMLMFNGFTLGSIASGFVTVALIERFGWQVVFTVGGLLPLAVVPLLLTFLPESLSWLAASESRRAGTQRLLRRINPNFSIDDVAIDSVDSSPIDRPTLADLFRQGRVRATALIWLIFLMNLLNTYLLVSWLPTIIFEQGFKREMAAVVGVVFQAGGLIGVLPIAWLNRSHHAAKILAGTFLIAAVSVPAIGLAGQNLNVIYVAAFFAGVGIISGQNAANALAADFYPTSLRATAVGAALGVGRIGSIVGPAVAGVLFGLGIKASTILIMTAAPALMAAAAALALSGSRITGSQLGKQVPV